MSSTKDDGGPAFPFEYEVGHGCRATHNGMSLRDYFAGQALIGAVSTNVRPIDTLAELARKAFEVADAMLKERAK